MVASPRRAVSRTRRAGAPFVWRALMRVDRAIVALTGRLVVTGAAPAGTPVILAANHIGNFDVLVLVAALRRLGLAPRFLATGGLFDTPVVGRVLRACGHVRVDRGASTAAAALATALTALRAGGAVVVYPEGRISTDPGLWPERGRTGVARLALTSGARVVPVSQWGAHEAMWWGSLTVEGWSDVAPLLASWARAARARPVFRVHVGAPVDLVGLDPARAGDARRAHERIMRAITAGLVPLRRDEPDVPRFADPTRPTTGSSPWRP